MTGKPTKTIRLKSTILRLLPIALGISVLVLCVNSCTHQPYVMPQNLRTGYPTLCFERDVLPIFQSNCAKSNCHDSRGAGGYILDTYADIVKKGIVPGNAEASKIFEAIDYKTGDDMMPKGAGRLPATDIEVIRLWIATGAIDSGACSTSNCDTTEYSYSGVIAPLIQLHCVGCHNSASAPGGSLETYADVQNAAVNGRLIGDISHTAGYNFMPLGGTQLLPCEITQIEKWVAAGAPNN
jgi:Planctomycete cytochrome C